MKYNKQINLRVSEHDYNTINILKSKLKSENKSFNLSDIIRQQLKERTKNILENDKRAMLRSNP